MNLKNIISKIFKKDKDKVTNLQAVKRLSICSKCGEFNQIKDICGVTNKYMPNNASWKNQRCPLGKWESKED